MMCVLMLSNRVVCSSSQKPVQRGEPAIVPARQLTMRCRAARAELKPINHG